MLVRQDKLLPSVVGIITGERLTTSWWNHPKAHEIFHCLAQLAEDANVLVSRLIGGKVTYIDRRLWAAFLAVATSHEPWQKRGLSEDARRLARAVVRTGVQRAKGSAARELQERLLVRSEEIHTEAGRHELVLQTWESWSGGRAVGPPISAAVGREQLERVVCSIGGNTALLPWYRFGKPKGAGPQPNSALEPAALNTVAASRRGSARGR
jgi:hypothetical protein